MAKPGHVYHWKHGWIPITPRAAMVKAKGNRRLADRLMRDHHIEDRRSEGRDRRQGGTVDVGDKRKGEHRGTFQYKPGTKTRDYPDRDPHGATGGPAPAPKPEAPKAPPAPKPKAPSGPEEGTAAHAFQDVAKGNHRALEGRTATLEGEATGKPYDVTIHTAMPVGDVNAPTVSDRDGNYVPAAWRVTFTHNETGNSGERYLADDAPVRLHPEAKAAPAPEPEAPRLGARETVVNAEKMHGTGSAEHLKALEMENRIIEMGLPANHKLEARRVDDPITGGVRGVLVAHHADGNRIGAVVEKDGQFRARYQGATIGVYDSRVQAHLAVAKRHEAEVGKPSGPRVPFGAEREAEDKRISDLLPPEQSVAGGTTTRAVKNNFGTWDKVTVERSTHYKNGRVLGYVTGEADGSGFKAEHRYIPLGRKNSVYDDLGGKTFESREAAHKAIADAEKAHLEKKAANEARKAARQAKKDADVNAGLAEVHGPGGEKWQMHELPDDGTWAGRQARAKAKQVFKAGDHTVVIEANLSPEHTKGLLADVGHSLDRAAPNLNGQKVKFIVPTGDKEFASGSVGAYVHVGGTDVYINPKIANEDKALDFFLSAESGHFSPVGRAMGVKGQRQYTITHELGHVTDNVHVHTHTTRDNWAPYSPDAKDGHAALVGEHGHSVYGTKNPAEGYAEAFAQWSLGGPGSSKTSDAYAEKYGWAPPGGDPIKAYQPGENVPTAAPKAPARTPEQLRRAMDDFERQFGLGKYAKTNAVSSDGPNPKDMTSWGNLGGGQGSIFDSEHSRLVREADARNRKPMSGSVKAAKDAAAAVGLDVGPLMGGKSWDQLDRDEVSAILRAALAKAKARANAKKR